MLSTSTLHSINNFRNSIIEIGGIFHFKMLWTFAMVESELNSLRKNPGILDDFQWFHHLHWVCSRSSELPTEIVLSIFYQMSVTLFSLHFISNLFRSIHNIVGSAINYNAIYELYKIFVFVCVYLLSWLLIHDICCSFS